MKIAREDYPDLIREIIKSAEGIEGCLYERDKRFLPLIALTPTAKGVILEIGSFKGKSTTLLAKAAKASDKTQVIAIDPLTSPSDTDPDLQGQESGEPDLVANLKKSGVYDSVEFHKKFSYELADSWDRPIRFLWIDGDHTYSGVKTDFDSFARHLSDGAIIAFHDMFDFDGPIRVFMEDVLLNPHFGSAGLCGGIGWAQYSVDPSVGFAKRQQKLKLYRQLGKLVPFLCLDPNHGQRKRKGWEKLKYKYYRTMVPHKEPTPEQWISQLVKPSID